MIERIKEENVWDFLKKDGKPVMIYGMGNGAEKIISTLNTYQITVSEIFASDEFVRGHSFLGYKVLKYSEVCEKYDDFNVVLAFATHLENVIENIKKSTVSTRFLLLMFPLQAADFLPENMLKNTMMILILFTNI